MLQREREREREKLCHSLLKAPKSQGLPQSFPAGYCYKRDKLPSRALLPAGSRSMQRENPHRAEQTTAPLINAACLGPWKCFGRPVLHFCTVYLQNLHWEGIVKEMGPSLHGGIWLYQMAKASWSPLVICSLGRSLWRWALKKSDSFVSEK